MSRPAVFLDRDGVLNVVLRGDYVRSMAQFEWLPGALEAIARLTAAGWPVVVVTNQSGIAKGLYTRADLEGIHEAMRRELEEHGGRVAAFYHCPHRDEDACDCRKPLPGMLLRAARDLDLDLSRSFFVGDSEIDMQAGRAAGCRVLAVTTGLFSADEVARWTPAPERVFRGVLEAAEWLETDAATAPLAPS